MHSLGVAHRDLKPDNIMLKEPWSPKPGAVPTLKIIDFGSATFCLAHETMKGHVGTKFFSAPEVLRRKRYTKKCDVWSVGVLLMVLLKGYPSGTAIEGQWRALQQGMSPTFPDTVPKHFIKLIKAALIMDPTRRPSCGSLLKAADDWLGASFTNNSVFTSPNKFRPARRLAVPLSFSDALRLHGESAAAKGESQGGQQLDHEEEDVSVYKGNSWELDLKMEQSFVTKGESLNIIDSLDEQGKRMAYQKHVTDMLSVVATPMEVHHIIQYISRQIRARNANTRRSSLDGEANDFTWCTAALLEQASRECKALETLTQLELARRLTGLDANSLSVDLNVLNSLDSLHERHMHVFNALATNGSKKNSNSSSPVKLNAGELSSVDDDRILVQSTAHTEMVYAMLSRGLSSCELSSLPTIPDEPSELTVRGGSAWFLEDWSNSNSSLPKINPEYDSSTHLDKSAILAGSESGDA
jgi:serine/threonine protein kinase